MTWTLSFSWEILMLELGKNCDFNREFDEICERVIFGNICNKHGQSFLEFLNESKFCVLNGRSGDKFVHYTSISTLGKAVVNYVCVPHDTLENCSDFKILPCNSIIESDILQEYLAARSKVPDHAFLLFDYHFKTRLKDSPQQYPHDDDDEPVVPNDTVARKRFVVKNIPADLMNSDLVKRSICDLTKTIELCRDQQNEIDNIYSEL